MPTYDYQCSDCSNAFYVQQRISEDPLTECPKCKGKIKRVISGGQGFLLKGSGYYQTDYKKNNLKHDNNADMNKCPQKKESCSEKNCPINK